MSPLSDANEKTGFRNSWFFKKKINTARDPTECNFDVISQSQKVCIARCKCVSSSLSNCLDLLISTAVLLELEYKCTGWSDGLKCQRRNISRSVSSPKSVTGQVFGAVMALDAISTSASPSECITLISEANSWSQAFQEKLVCYLDAEESHLFSQSMDYGGMVQFFFLAFLYFVWYVYCPL